MEPPGDTVKSFFRRFCRFLAIQEGPTAVEYAVLLALIVVISLAAVKTVGTNGKKAFKKVANSIAGS